MSKTIGEDSNLNQISTRAYTPNGIFIGALQFARCVRSLTRAGLERVFGGIPGGIGGGARLMNAERFCDLTTHFIQLTRSDAAAQRQLSDKEIEAVASGYPGECGGGGEVFER